MSEKLQEWSQKLGVPVETLQGMVNQAKQKLIQLYPNRDDAFYTKRALRLVALQYAKQLRSPAVTLVGVVFAVGPKVDTTSAMANMARQLWADPNTRAQAIADGIVTEDGTPLDTRRELAPGRKNPNYGKPLQPFYQRNALGIFKKFGETQKKLTVMTLRQEKADLELPLNKPIQLRMNVREESDYMMVCTSSRATEVQPSNDPDFAGWTPEKTMQMLDSAPFKVSPLELDEYYEKHKDERIVFALIEGDLITVDETPTSTGNYRCELGDLEADIAALPTSMFVPADMYESTIKNLGLGSRLIVVARLTLGMDIVTGERTRVNINPIAIFPKYVVTKEESLLEFESVGA